MRTSKHHQLAVTKAVIPAAGLGTRLYPLTKAIPKELLPVVDKPLIDYVVQEAVEAGIKDLLVVIRPGKEQIAEHLATSAQHTHWHVDERVAAPPERHLRDDAPLIHFVYQYEQKGLGHAVACAQSFVGQEPFAVLLADNITTAPRQNVTSQLISVFQNTGCPVIGLEKIAPDMSANYGIADIRCDAESQVMTIEDLVEKPAPENAPSDYAIASRYVLTPPLFDYLNRTVPGRKNEIQLTDAMRLMLQDQEIKGLQFDGQRHDIGNKADYLRTLLRFAAQDPELAAVIRAFQTSSDGADTKRESV